MKHPSILARFLRGILVAALAASAVAPVSAQLANGEPKFLGNIIGNHVPASYNTYWNQVTPENAGKWESVEGVRDVMNWANLDLAVNFAVGQGYVVKQHTMVWGSQEPGWIAALPAVDQVAEVEEWFQLVAQRYPALDQIDVVNEPLHVLPSYMNAIGGSGATGWDWVIWSFEKARQHFPNAELLLNDYGILGSKKATSDYVKIINLLKDRGLIDAIGVQCHGLEYAQSSMIQSNLDKLALTGLPIYITELELEHADGATQLGMYQRVFPLLYEHPSVVGVTLWGYLAGEHWKPDAYLLGSVQNLGSWTMGTTFADYTITNVNATKLHVELTNDVTDNARDLQVDYIIVDGVTYQAEDMEVNTGVWTGTCGGSFSEWLNCGGYIEFPGGVGTVTIRARGVIGTENMRVVAIDDTVERPALTWLGDYFGGGSGPCTPTDIHVDAILLSTWNAGQGNKGGQAQVTVVDDCGNPISGVTVSGTFTGDFNESHSAVTNASGVAILQTVGVKKGGVSITFCVDNVTGSLPYDSADNVESCDSL